MINIRLDYQYPPKDLSAVCLYDLSIILTKTLSKNQITAYQRLLMDMMLDYCIRTESK